MSSDDPFGNNGGGRTVIRPNPGGGGGPAAPRPQPGGTPIYSPQPGPGPGQPPPAYAPPGQTPYTPGYAAPGTPAYNPAGPGYNPRVNAPIPNPGGYGQPGAPGMPQGEDWLRGPVGGALFPDNAPQGAVVETPKIPLEVALNARDGGQMSAANPITAAAAPLLILLGRLRLMIVDMQAVPLMQHVANEIQNFERRITGSGVEAHDADVAKYALCATADDIVQNLPGTDKHVWLQYSMVAQFYRVRNSGVGFYEELNKILANPAPRYNLLELMHACLSLGFEGQYRNMPNGANDLQRIRRDVYQTIRHLQARNDDDVSPRWRGLDLKMSQLTSRLPLWALVSAAAALLLAVFFVLRILLGGDADGLADRLIALHPQSGIELTRQSAFVPAKVPDSRDQTQLERIRDALGTKADNSCVAADSVGDDIIIKVCNVLLFDSGSAQVKKQFAGLADRIAASLQKEPGSINIVGYTDNVKPSGLGRFKSNFDLSVARAKAVEAIIAAKIEDPGRIKVEGKGELNPIAPNTTDTGRAQNRRVELMIPRQETLPQQPAT